MQSRQALYQGEAGNYFGYQNVAMPANIDQRIMRIDQDFQQQEFKYLGRLNCSYMAQITAYIYATTDQRTSISVTLSNNALIGVDCVSKTVDGSFLTSTNIPGNSDDYQHQGLYCNAYPQFDAVALVMRHQADLVDFQQQHGNAQAVFQGLVNVAQMLDEYILRQKASVPSNKGFSQWIGGFRNKARA
jgi:hypothetical protein